jgi:hypothetical protein
LAYHNVIESRGCLKNPARTPYGSQTTQDRTTHSRLPWLSCCLPPLGIESASCSFGFSKLNSPAHWYLCLRFSSHLAVYPARLEARMDSLFSFPVGLFHPLQHAGLSRRTPSGRLIVLNTRRSRLSRGRSEVSSLIRSNHGAVRQRRPFIGPESPIVGRAPFRDSRPAPTCCGADHKPDGRRTLFWQALPDQLSA